MREALSDNLVILLEGARQSGKSTLVRGGELGEFPGDYLTLDDAGVLRLSQCSARAIHAVRKSEGRCYGFISRRL